MPDLISQEEIQSAITNGRIQRESAFRVVVTGGTSAAGRFHECITGVGTGGSFAFPGTAGAATQMSRASAGSLPLNGTLSVPRRLLTFTAQTPTALIAPGSVSLVDYLLYYPGLSASSPTALNNAVGLPARAATATDIQAAGIVTTVFGAANPVFNLTYTDQGGTGSNAGQLVLPGASAPVGTWFGGGVAGSPGAMFASLAAGDTGVQSVQSYTITSGTTGAWALVLYRILATVPIVAANAFNEKNLVFDITSMPEIPNDACLGLVVNVGGALTANQVIQTRYEYAWGTP